MTMQVGKLYQVVALHPEEVSEPADHRFYPGSMASEEEVEWFVGYDEWFELEVGDIFLFLGNLSSLKLQCKGYKYLMLLFNGKIWGSNVPTGPCYDYLELKRVG